MEKNNPRSLDITGPFRRRPRFVWTAPWILSILIFTAVQLALNGTNTIPGGTLAGRRFCPESLQQILLTVPSAEKARGWSAFYTSGPHLPGQGQHQAEWTKAQWEDFGLLETEIVTFDTPVPYPKDQSQRLALLQTDGTGSQVLHEAVLMENVTTTNGQDESASFMQGYFAFSENGNITAQYVFANFGSEEDFDGLRTANVDVKGKIAILKSAQVSPYFRLHHLEMFRGLQIRNAYARGVAGVVVYPDPQSDGEINPSNGYPSFPDGPARPATMMERGTLGSLADYLNNVSLPTVPCLPISYADAIPLLKALNGHGPAASTLDSRWHGGGLGYQGVNYNLGPSPADVKLNLVNRVELESGQLHQVFGTIRGSEIEDEVIILGNHRDSWGTGAGDPNSGSSALNEVVRSFGVALARGWSPRRTIIFASWEGEEIGQVGSQTWIQANFPWLNATAVAYLNVVVAASGKKFHVKASPLLSKVVYEATSQVLSPNQTVPGQSVFDVWGGEVGTAGGGDAMRFQNSVCVSTVDFGFSPGLDEPVFPYHSLFDTWEWMDQYGDPTWEHHLATTKIWSLMAAALVETPVLVMNVTDYASTLNSYLDSLEQSRDDHWPADFDLASLYDSVEKLHEVSIRFDAIAASLSAQVRHQHRPWWRIMSGSDTALHTAIREVNQRYISFERMFFYEPGLDNNDAAKHVFFAPSAWHMNAEPFPALRNSLAAGNSTNAEKWKGIIVDRINNAVSLLAG